MSRPPKGNDGWMLSCEITNSITFDLVLFFQPLISRKSRIKFLAWKHETWPSEVILALKDIPSGLPFPTLAGSFILLGDRTSIT
jgi:hypothetical protein